MERGIQAFRYRNDIKIWALMGVFISLFLTSILIVLWRMGYSEPREDTKISAKLS